MGIICSHLDHVNNLNNERVHPTIKTSTCVQLVCGFFLLLSTKQCQFATINVHLNELDILLPLMVLPQLMLLSLMKCLHYRQHMFMSLVLSKVASEIIIIYDAPYVISCVFVNICIYKCVNLYYCFGISTQNPCDLNKQQRKIGEFSTELANKFG